MKFFPGEGKVREFSGWPEKFRKDLESQDLKINGNGRQSRKFIFSVQEGKGCTVLEVV